MNLKEHFSIDFINYRKTSDKIGKIKADISFDKNEININNIEYNEGKNLISLNKFNINKKNQIKRFKNIKVKTFKKVNRIIILKFYLVKN